MWAHMGFLTCSAARQPSAMDWYTARSLASLTGASMKPQASLRNSGSSRNASCPTPGAAQHLERKAYKASKPSVY